MLISGTPVNDNKGARFALSALYGIGTERGKKLCARLGLRPNARLRSFSGMQTLSKVTRDHVPKDLLRQQRDRVKFLVNLKHYRGLRHMFALPCRGQRCRTNARTVKRVNPLPSVVVKQPQRAKARR
jgi:small subunit ribosomal protein S13